MSRAKVIHSHPAGSRFYGPDWVKLSPMRHPTPTGVALAALLCIGCTPTQPITPPTQPATTPTTQQATLEQAKQNFLSYEAEIDRLVHAGGAQEPTQVMLQYAMGEYLDGTMQLLKQQAKEGWIPEGTPKIGSFKKIPAAEGYDISITTCTDGRDVTYREKNGTRSSGRVVQNVADFKLVDGRLMLARARDEVGGICDV